MTVHQVGDAVRVVVTAIDPEKEQGVEPGDAIRAGDRVRVKIVGIDQERRRLSLSIRQADARNARTPNV